MSKEQDKNILIEMIKELHNAEQLFSLKQQIIILDNENELKNIKKLNRDMEYK